MLALHRITPVGEKEGVLYFTHSRGVANERVGSIVAVVHQYRMTYVYYLDQAHERPGREKRMVLPCSLFSECLVICHGEGPNWHTVQQLVTSPLGIECSTLFRGM